MVSETKGNLEKRASDLKEKVIDTIYNVGDFVVPLNGLLDCFENSIYRDDAGNDVVYSMDEVRKDVQEMVSEGGVSKREVMLLYSVNPEIASDEETYVMLMNCR